MTTTIEALPPPGQRSAPATYVALMDAWHSAIAAYSEQASAAATEINGANAASAALVAAATAMVNAAAIAAGAVAWVSGTTYAQGDVRYSPTNFQSYRRKTNGAGTTDPVSDATNWAPISADLTSGPTLNAAVITGGASVAGGLTVTGGATVTGVLSITGALTETAIAMAADDIDLEAGSSFSKTITGATTLTVSNAPAAGRVASFVLDLTNPGSNVTWWAGIIWPGGAVPTGSASGRDRYVFFSSDAGASWVGIQTGKGFA